MRRALATLGLVLSVAGCNDSASELGGATTPSTSTTVSQRLLSEKELSAALLSLQDVPPGYSQDPPSEPDPSKTFCDYVPPFQEKIRVKREFTKGGGLSAEFLGVGFRQYADAGQAKATFEALSNALASCTGETYDGRRVTSDDGPDLLQFFALLGPVLVNTGGGGMMNTNAEEVISLFKAQVGKYEAAAE